MELLEVGGEDALADPAVIAEMLDEPVSAMAMPSAPPVTISIVANVTMNDGSLVRTTIRPLARPIGRR